MAAIDGPTGPKATRFDLTRQPSDEQLATVQAGESRLVEVAKRLGQTLKALMQANQHIPDANNLRPGQDVRLPQTQAMLEVAAAAEMAEAPPPVGSAEQRLDDPLAKTMAKLQWQHGRDGQVGPGTVLAWKQDGPGGTSNTTKAPGAKASVGSVSV